MGQRHRQDQGRGVIPLRDVGDVLAVAGGGTAGGDLGNFATLSMLGGLTYMAGGLVFGIALFRANVLARWASILLAVATPLSLAIPLLPRRCLVLSSSSSATGKNPLASSCIMERSSLRPASPAPNTMTRRASSPEA